MLFRSSREGDKWTMRLAAEVPAEAPVEAPAESPAQSPAPGGREDGMASSTTRKFKSLQAALAEPRLIGGWRLARKMMNCNAGSSVGARRNDGRDLRSERETTCTPEIECSSWRREVILTCTWDLPECALPVHTPPKHVQSLPHAGTELARGSFVRRRPSPEMSGPRRILLQEKCMQGVMLL